MNGIVDILRQMFEQIRDERNIAANTATRIGNAFLALLNYLLNSPFIRKDAPDQTEYLLSLLAGAVIGESNNITLNPDGSITCGSIRVDGSAIFDELVINHQNILEGDTFFTDNAIIESVERIDMSTYQLTMRKLYDDDRVTFHVNDVLKGVLNNLDTQRSFKTSWFRVQSIDTSDNSMVVVVYDDEDVPGGTNYAPQAPMKVARWGNATDENRQSCFFVSATDGTFLFLQGVTQPIIDDTNYSAFLGLPPDMRILDDLPINKKQPYIYAKGLIAQDIIRIDYQGNPVYEIRDRGQWSATDSYIKAKDTDSNNYYQDQVWHNGCVWRCGVTSATVGREPRYNNPDWICVSGSGNFSVEIYSSAGNFFRAGAPFATTLQTEVRHGEAVLTQSEIGLANITWTRESTDTAGDAAWNALHQPGTVGLHLSINNSDMPSDWLTDKKVAFKIEIVLNETALTSNFSMQL